jgi:hypothetical protein
MTEERLVDEVRQQIRKLREAAHANDHGRQDEASDSILLRFRELLAHVDALGREKGELADLVKYMTPTEAMVERAAVELAAVDYEKPWHELSELTQHNYRITATTALTAALSCPAEAPTPDADGTWPCGSGKQPCRCRV